MINAMSLVQSASDVKAELSEKVKKMEERLKEKESENKKLKDRVSELQNIVGDLTKRNEECEKKIRQMESEKAEASVVVSESIKGKIVKASGLPNVYENDFYVTLAVLTNGEKDIEKGIKKTNMYNASVNPVWSFDFEFANTNKNNSLVAEVFSPHKVLGDCCIGSVEIPLNDLKENTLVEKTFAIQKPKKVSKAIRNVDDFGYLTLSLEYNVVGK